MKKIYLSILSSLMVAISFATVHTITNSGQTFTPDSIDINVGDSVNFAIGASHDVFQYEEPKFNNTSFSSGDATQSGFSLPAGGGAINDFIGFLIPGTYYYVCSPHFGNGMKGKITVAHGAPIAPCSELFFSQYLEGGGSNKAVEIYNPTSSAVDLSLYTLVMYNNGGNAVNSLALTGMLGAGSTYVISKSGSDIAANADLINGIMNHNGDDAYALVKNGIGAVDIIGYFNDKPSQFNVDGGDTKDNTLTRKASVNAGTTNWDDSFSQWDVAAKDDTVGFGSHTMNPCIVGSVVSFKTDSFEYNEGDDLVSLDSILISPAVVGPTTESFEIHLGAGSTATTADFDVTGFPGFVSFPQTVPLALANFSAQALEVTIVDDALLEGTEWVQIVLRNGQNGLNIGADSTLYLKIIDNDVTEVSLVSNSLTVGEDAGSFDIDLDYSELVADPSQTVDLELISTTNAADVDGFTTATATFNTTTEKFTVNITEDVLIEGTEVLTFALTNATNGLIIGSDSIFTLTIIDNDYPFYPIELLRGNDTDAVADSLNVKCWTTGYVMGNSLSTSAMEFSIHNGTKGMGVYIPASAGTFGYTLVEGDSLMILGTVGQFNGFSQMTFVDTLYQVGTSMLQIPTLVTDTLGEYTESELVTIENALHTGGTWDANETVTIEANGLEYTVRLDAETGIDAASAPAGAFNITGLGSQYNFSTTELFKGYQLKPRYVADIELLPTVNFDEQGSSVNEDAGTVTINFTVANDNGGSYTVDVELTSGDAADLDGFTTLTAVAVTGGMGSFDVTITDDTEVEGNEGFVFTLTNASTGLTVGNGNTYDLTVTDNDADAIAEINVNALTVYPNPASEKVVLKMISNEKQIANVTLVDVIGQTIQSNTFMLNNGSNAIELDLTNVANGNYMINISTENGSHTESLLVR